MTQAAKLAALGSSGNTTGMKNRIINGDMRIDQRNGGGSVTVNAFGKFAVDRFLLDCRPSTGSFNAQQVSDAPAGFVNSLKLTQASVSSAVSSDVYSAYQRIEGYNTANLNWGTANAATITISFWVKASVTGVYGLAVQNINATRRSYVTTYTINAANTWEYKTVTVAGDTTGTWETTTSTGIMLWWDLGSGSDYQTSTLNSWQTSNVFQSTTGTRWMATSGATWQVTGVQLEAGTTATNFDFRSYGTELALCQRYYTYFGNSSNFESSCGLNGTGRIRGHLVFPVTMRAAPTFSLIGTPTFYGYMSNATYSSVTVTEQTTQSGLWDFTVTGVSAGTGGTWMGLRLSSGVQIQYSAEL